MKSGITAANQLAKYNLPGLSSEERKILNKSVALKFDFDQKYLSYI